MASTSNAVGGTGAPAPVPQASRQKSDKWFVRVDGSKEFLLQKCGELSKCIDVRTFLCAYHTGKTKENPHVHFVIEIANQVQKQSFAVRIKNHFSIEKKSNYSLNVWDGNRGMGAVSYLFHEEDAIIDCNVGFTAEDLANARQANTAIQAVVAVNAERASGKLVNRALEQFAGSALTGSLRYEILLFMLKEIKAGTHYHPGMFRLKSMVEEVQIKLANNEELEDLAFAYEKNLWRE